MLITVKLTVNVYADTLSDAARKVEQAIDAVPPSKGSRSMWVESVDKVAKQEGRQ